MPHKTPPGKQYMGFIKQPKLLAYCVLVTLLVLIATLVTIIFITRQNPPSSASVSQISVRGTVICLPHKDTSGPQTLECAFGLRTNDNRHYLLQNFTPSQTTAEVNTVVQVQGTLSPPAPDTLYDIIGVITVDSLQPQQ